MYLHDTSNILYLQRFQEESPRSLNRSILSFGARVEANHYRSLSNGTWTYDNQKVLGKKNTLISIFLLFSIEWILASFLLLSLTLIQIMRKEQNTNLWFLSKFV